MRDFIIRRHSYLTSEGEFRDSLVEVNGSTQKVPSYIINNHILWGATAIMVHEFVLLFKQMINS